MVACLTVEHLGKRYRLGTKLPREFWALRNVSFVVDPGTIVGVIGPNGAGKTTLLKVLARITPPTEGRVTGRGRVVPLLALGSGFQPDLSGRENVFLNAALYGISSTDVAARFDEIVDFAGVRQFIDVPLKRYSSGMYMRLAFSIAVNMRPDILLADEVLAVGDLEFQERCLQRVVEAGKSGMAVLFVSHDMTAITRLCHRALWLNAGEVVKYGETAAVVTEYQNHAWRLPVRLRERSGSHVSPLGEIITATLTTADGREVGAIRVSDEVFIKIAIAILERNTRVRLTLRVHTSGQVAFRTRSPEDYAIGEAAAYYATVRVPGNLLAAAIYTIHVDAVIIRGAESSSLVAHNALTFQVFDPASDERDVTPGAVAPRLDWNLSRSDGLAVPPPSETKATQRP